MKKKALITGITGQDGSHLAELLLSKDYQVFGLVRRSGFESLDRISHIEQELKLVQGDLLDQPSLEKAIALIQPDEVYNLAAMSFIPTSWNQPVLTGEFTALGAARLLEAIHQIKPHSRFYQASSSEMFGKAKECPQNESTPFYPRSPYGVAKSYAHFITVNYRESYNVFACCGIMFNHESPRRGLEFVSRKISYGAVCVKLGLAKELRLGNLNSARDWGFAGDYVEAMWLMLNQDKPEDFVIATGETHTVREFAELAFSYLGLDWRDYVQVDQNLLRPVELERLVGDATKAKEKLGWKPKVKFPELVKMMVDSDLKLLNKQIQSGAFPSSKL